MESWGDDELGAFLFHYRDKTIQFDLDDDNNYYSYVDPPQTEYLTMLGKI
jgi:hypothetical protein